MQVSDGDFHINVYKKDLFVILTKSVSLFLGSLLCVSLFFLFFSLFCFVPSVRITADQERDCHSLLCSHFA